ncbi:MAG: two pore domain potassium channel family protein [Lachnospiraceae bacterium]|nr:two pore domain potassium channel family protein [Lachnospiraceae bacterium]
MFSADGMVIYLSSFLFLLFTILGIEGKRRKAKMAVQTIISDCQSFLLENGRLGRKLIKAGIILMTVVLFIKSYLDAIRITGKLFTIYTLGNVIFKTVIYVVAATMFIIIPVFLINKLYEFIVNIRNTRLSIRLLKNLLILTIYTLFLWPSRAEMTRYASIIFTVLIITYILNIQMLIWLTIEPMYFFRDCSSKVHTYEHPSPLRTLLTGAILLLVLILLNLYLGVAMVSYTYKGAYYSTVEQYDVSLFDLFYYTIISFTTIGSGDIIPVRAESKLMAIIISLTSVMCLVIFISSLLSQKDRLRE